MNDFFLSIFQRTLHKNLLWFSNNEAVINKGFYSQVKEALLLLIYNVYSNVDYLRDYLHGLHKKNSEDVQRNFEQDKRVN